MHVTLLQSKLDHVVICLLYPHSVTSIVPFDRSVETVAVSSIDNLTRSMSNEERENKEKE